MSHPYTYMQRCLELAEKGRQSVAPNPMVGAVLVHNHRIIGEGWHRRYGEAHAEVACLENVSEEDKHLIPQSTMYVSLEPCAHYGKTPPCAQRLVAEKVKQVIVCNNDPFDAVHGKGFEILQQHGIPAEQGLLEKAGLWLNRRFFCYHQRQRPYVILKWAQTQQAFFAPQDRSRFQMSNKHSQQLVHKWRTEESAILVGYHTALRDDPQLNARLWRGPQPLRIVLDRKLQLPDNLKMKTDGAPTWIVNEQRDGQDGAITYLRLEFNDSILQQLLQRLHHERKLSLIVEGGAALLNSFIQQQLWDEARVFETLNVLEEGIPAPRLSPVSHAFTSCISTDRLHVYTHPGTLYPYFAGMAL